MTPESLLRDALHARDEWRYADVVAMVDPASMHEYFATFCQASRPRTIEAFAAQYPELSGDQLTTSFSRWMEVSPDPEGMIAHQVAGVSTYAELIALTPESFLERALTAGDPRFHSVERMRQRGREVPAAWCATPPNVRYDIIGSVPDSDDFVHVLYRTHMDDAVVDISRAGIELETLRRQPDGSWRFLAGWGRNFLRTRYNVAYIIDDDGLFDDIG